ERGGEAPRREEPRPPGQHLTDGPVERRDDHTASACPPCRAPWSSCSSSLDREVFRTVPPYLLIASTALSVVTFSSIRNRHEVPGCSRPRTCSWNCLSMEALAKWPMSAPIPAPIASPKTGMKNSRPNRNPQKLPQTAPPAVA